MPDTGIKSPEPGLSARTIIGRAHCYTRGPPRALGDVRHAKAPRLGEAPGTGMQASQRTASLRTCNQTESPICSAGSGLTRLWLSVVACAKERGTWGELHCAVSRIAFWLEKQVRGKFACPTFFFSRLGCRCELETIKGAVRTVFGTDLPQLQVLVSYLPPWLNWSFGTLQSSVAMRSIKIAGLALFASCAVAQTHQRLGGCPSLGCVFPPDQADFLPGQYFDVRLEVHSPVNGSEARKGEPDPNFKFTIAKKGKKAVPADEYFDVDEPKLERWNFTWYEDLFAEDAGKASLVNVTSKAYRRVALYEPGEYEATLTYYGKEKTVANWLVRDVPKKRRAKNVVLFVGDGMTTNMITAARLIAHKSINGKYMTKMALDKFPVLGHQMTHSMDSFITDSANSATALYSGHKTTVNALNVYVDSSEDPFDDPKFEIVTEIFRRRHPDAGVGIVSTAFLADATPAALSAHTSNRGEYEHVISSFYEGLTDLDWEEWNGPDVLFGAGAEAFLKSEDAARDYYNLFAEKGYSVSWNNTALHSAPNDTRALGVFATNNLPTWLDRNVYQSNLQNQSNYPDGSGRDAEDLPGLKDMTLKAIDVLNARHSDDGWFLMSEAASIDKQMHTLDYDRSLGELLELDDTVKATIQKLETLGELEDTLIVVTADHGHGFDVTGAVDTKYMNAQEDDRAKRRAIGYYENSGLSQYTVGGPNALRYSEGVHFPARWDPRYTLHSGVVAFPDHRENYEVHKDGPRLPAVEQPGSKGNFANYKDAVTGYLVNGTLPVDANQGVHSLTDVPVFAQGPCQELFGGVYNSIDIFFNIAECLGLAETKRGRGGKKGHGN